MTDAVNKSSVQSLLNGTGRNENDLKAKFNAAVADAKNSSTNIVSIGQDKADDYVAASWTLNTNSTDSASYVVDMGTGKDTFLLDGYTVKDISDIKITRESVKIKDKDGNDTVNSIATVKVLVKDSSGKMHSYNLSNLEKLKYADESGTVHTLVLNPKSSKLGENEQAYHFGAGNFKPNQMASLSNQIDYTELYGDDSSINSKGGDDFFRAYNLGTGKDIDTVNGGGGQDTLDVKSYNLADVKSLTQDKSGNFNLTMKDDKSIIFKNIENFTFKDYTAIIETKTNNGVKTFSFKNTGDAPEDLSTPPVVTDKAGEKQTYTFTGTSKTDLFHFQADPTAAATYVYDAGGSPDKFYLKGNVSEYTFKFTNIGERTYTITDNSGNTIILKNFEKLQIGDTEYNISLQPLVSDDPTKITNQVKAGDSADHLNLRPVAFGEELTSSNCPYYENTYLPMRGQPGIDKIVKIAAPSQEQ